MSSNSYGWEAIILPSFLSLYSLVGCFWMFSRRRRRVIQKRGYEFSITATLHITVALWAMGLLKAPSSVPIPPSVSCAFHFWFLPILIPMWLFPYILRAAYLDFQTQFNRKKLRSKFQNDRDFLFSKYPYLTDRRLYYAIYLLIFILASLTPLALSQGAGAAPGGSSALECLPNNFQFVFGFIGILVLLSAGFYTYRLWNATDAYHLKMELKIFLISFPLPFGIAMASLSFSRLMLLTFVLAFVCCLATISISIYYPIFLSYRPEWRLRKSILSGTDTSFYDGKVDSKELFKFCLNQPDLLDAFIKYAAELWCAENIQFYIETQGFKELSSSSSISVPLSTSLSSPSFPSSPSSPLPSPPSPPKGAHFKAEEILSTYIRPSATSGINIDQATQATILERFEREGAVSNLFQEAETAVIGILRNDTFLKFRTSGRMEQAWVAAGLGTFEIMIDVNMSEKNASLSTAAIELLEGGV